MMRVLVLPVALFALLGAQNTAPVSAPRPPSEHPPQLSTVDDAFAVAATQGNAAELAMARLALARSQSDSVRAFARNMIVDHTTIDAEGRPIIRQFRPPSERRFGATDVLAIAYLQSLTAVDFDQQYALAQIGDHLATQTAFATEARDGKNPTLKAFAKKWLPTIQAHVQLAIALVRHVGGDTPFRN